MPNNQTGKLTDVEEEELNDAIWYFEGMGFLDELTSDKKHYVEILLKNAKLSLNGS
tara:strand:+ start:13393 stop:13560 length:168 start_codon:yes stop_codon:yes gene_type:complete